MYCRNCGAPIDQGSYGCKNCNTQAGISKNFCPNCGSPTTEYQDICGNCKFPLNQTNYYYNQTAPHSRIVAGILAILVGYLGIHNFYLGYTNKGIVQVLVATIGSIFTCGIAGFVIWIWALVEGVQILTGYINIDARGIPFRD